MDKSNYSPIDKKPGIVTVSLYKLLTDKINIPIEIPSIFQMIRSGKDFKPIIDQLRSETNKAKADSLKKKLPALTPSGLFNGQRKAEHLIKYSGLICLDFDYVKNAIEVKNNLLTDPYTYSVFISPSGNGIKLFVRVRADKTKHNENFYSLQSYYSKKYKLTIDKSCKDITRLMFLSYDKELFVNEKSKEWNITEYNNFHIEFLLEQFKKKETFLAGNRNNFVFKFASICSKEGIEKNFCQGFVKDNFADTDFHFEEISKSINSAYSNISNIPKQADHVVNNKSASPLERVEKYISEKYEIRLNEVANKVEYRDINTQNKFIELNENSLYREIEHTHIPISINKISTLMQSDFVTTYNPFNEYFENLKVWEDNEPDYILKLTSYLPVKDKERFEIQFKKMLVRCVACSLDEKVFNKQVFILVHDKQNSGKTTFCRWLCPDALSNYLTENINTDKDSLITLATNFLINMDELATLSKAEINTLKSFISKDKINARLPYGTKPVIMPRRANFIGSTNKDEFLTDETGSVRWLCFELIDNINFKYKVEINIDDVWRQAYSLWKSGFQYQLTLKEVEENETANKNFQVNSFEYEVIQKTYSPGSKDSGSMFVTATDIFNKISFNNPAIKFNLISIGKAMKLLGFARTQNYLKKPKEQSIKGYFVNEL